MGYLQMTRNVESIFGAVVTAPHQIPYTYTATGGETFISLPFYPVTGVVTVNGSMQVPLDNFEIDGNTVNLGRALEVGDVVYCLFDKILSPEDYKNGIRIYKFQAVGGETEFTPDFTSYGVQSLYIGGEYKTPEIEYSYNSTTGKVSLQTALTAGVWVVAEMSVKQPNISPLFDRSIQEIARSANVKDSEVIVSTDTAQVLNGKTIVFDVVTQHIYGLPTLPTNVYILSINNGKLTYSPGNIEVDLVAIPGSVSELEAKLFNNGVTSTLWNNNVVVVDSIKDLVELAVSDLKESSLYYVKGFYTDSDLGGGLFKWNAAVPGTSHNGWRVLSPSVAWSGLATDVPAYLTAIGFGAGCFVRSFDGTATPEMAGAVTDWDGTNGTDCSASVNALLIDTELTAIEGSGKTYWFGDFSTNQTKYTITRFLPMDWKWSTLVARGAFGTADYSSCLFAFKDVGCSIKNYTFDDISFSYTTPGNGRGIQPVTILSETKSTSGFDIGPCHIERGQSIVTVATIGPVGNRSRNIKLHSPVTAGDVYYGINCANNGDFVFGEYTLRQVNRALFCYGNSDVDVRFTANKSIPASASVLFSQYGSSLYPTQRIKVRGHFGEINGPILIADDVTTGGNGIYRDLDIDISYDTLGSNIPVGAPVIRMGCYNASSVLIEGTTQQVTTDNIKVNLTPGAGSPALTAPFKVYTPSPKHGLWIIGDRTPIELSALMPVSSDDVFGTPIYQKQGTFFRGVHGALNTTGRTVRIPVAYLSARPTTVDFSIRLNVVIRNGASSTSPKRTESFLVVGYLDSSGNITLNTVTSIGVAQYGSAGTVAVTVSSDFKSLNVAVSGYANTLGMMTAYWSLADC